MRLVSLRGDYRQSRQSPSPGVLRVKKACAWSHPRSPPLKFFGARGQTKTPVLAIHKDRRDKLYTCGTTLIAAPEAAPSAGMPAHSLPCNAGTRRRLLGTFDIAPFTPPSAVHLPARFRPHSQRRGLSLRALPVLSPLHRFSLLNTIPARLSSLFIKNKPLYLPIEGEDISEADG